MDVMWDLLVFLALVAVGLVLLNLMARRRSARSHEASRWGVRVG
jgi:hypothetical protein